MEEKKRRLDDWISGYLKYTENTEPCQLYRLWTAISVVASAMQRKCFTDWGMLRFYPNLYIVLVGPSGSRKGTAMEPGRRFLTTLGMSLAADATTKQALIKRLKQSSFTTVDRNGKVILHSSLTIFSEELTVFIGYKNLELMTDLCNWWDCLDRWTYETKHQGTDEVVGVWVNLLGATTPELLRSALPAEVIGSGLTARIIFVYADKRGKVVPYPFVSDECRIVYDDLLHDLEIIHMLNGRMKFTENFMSFWEKWYIQHDRDPGIKDQRLAGYMRRKPAHLFKLSMIMSASRSNEMVLRVQDLKRAEKILRTTEALMPNAFGGMGDSPISNLVHDLMKTIALEGTVTKSDLMRRYIRDADSWTLGRALKVLEEAGYIKVMFDGREELIKYQPS